MVEVPRPDREARPQDELPPQTVAPTEGYTGGESTPRSPAGELPPQAELGEYRLLEKLGQGGMGAVYKALHTRLEKIVALKMLPEGLSGDPRLIGRFEREMKAAGRVTHPNIIQAHDARQIGAVRFLVTEYVDGMDLERLAKCRGRLPIAEACELARQAALGLQAAHEHGLVHRDIKPSNVMLTRQGLVKVLDLGLARMQAGPAAGEQATRSGLLMGTVDYMAPEQVSDCHNVDIRADIYSLGCTLYQLLSGKLPFGGPKFADPLEKMTAKMLHTPDPLRTLRRDVPERLAGVVERMMAKLPSDRYATPAEVAEALTPFAAGADLVALWKGDLARPEPPPRPGQRRLGLAALAIVLVAAGLAGWRLWPATVRPVARPVVVKPEPQPAPQPKPKAADPGSKPEPKPSADAERAGELQKSWAKKLGMPVEQTNSIGMKLVLIPPGTFMMGTAESEAQATAAALASETPAHQVEITRPFLLGACEVTQAEFRQVMGRNPSHFSPEGPGRERLADQDTGRLPVESVTWSDAEEFCRRLSGSQGEHSARRVYRLPTEAEWEYACRAGSATRWWYGDADAELDACAWLTPAAGNSTHPIGRKRANPWGLRDVYGNVFEWCSDWFAADYYRHSPAQDPIGPATGVERVIRGGSWWNRADHCRSAARVGAPRDGSELIGFRVLCEVGVRPSGP